MKKVMAIVMVLVFVLSVSAMAKTKVKINIAGHRTSSASYLGDRGLGIGIEFGLSNGLDLKTWVSDDSALQFDLNWGWGWGIGFGAAYLIHNFDIIEMTDSKVPLYFGIKGAVGFGGNAVGVAILVPLGIAWIPREYPIDVFLQIEPGLELFPATGFAYGGGIGIRYWLD
jgi:hypothetical protein